MGLTCFKSWKYDCTTGKAGNRDVLVSPGSYFFLSNSCGQGEEWLRTLNKGVWIPFTGVFGQRLDETVLYERRYGEHTVPLVVEQCVGFIRQRGLLEVGLFRQPGQATLVKELQEAFDTGEKPSFDSSTDVHTVASLLKLYLRELPEPVVPYCRYQDFLLCGKIITTDRKQSLAELKRLLHELPVVNFNLLHYICQFLYEVQSYSNTNKMSIQNLATVFGPNILRPKAEDPESIIGGAAVVQQLMAELIGGHDSLFCRDEEADSTASCEPHALLPQGQRADPTGGERAEPVRRPRCSCPESTGSTHPSHCQFPGLSLYSLAHRQQLPQSLPNKAAPHCLTAVKNQGLATPLLVTLGDVMCKEERPACSHLLAKTTAASSAVTPPQISSEGPTVTSALDGPGPSTAAAASSSQGALGQRSELMEARCSSSLRDRHRSAEAYDSTLSVYDNIDPSFAERAGSAPPFGAPEDSMTSANSSCWSSCEIIVPTISHSPSLRTEPDEHQLNSPSSSALTGTLLSSGSSEVFLPSVVPQAPDVMQGLLASLQQHMTKQKVQYEAQIKSLERRNEALQDEVAALRAKLEQQRRWSSVAEMKMRNAERARADADRRNAALQHEMEQFFDTFGELNMEANKTERFAQSF